MLAPVSESFVDLSYRGLPLGRRIKLTQVRPSSGFLELAAPMPVGTAIVITTDEGLALEATVMQIHEQIGGSERVPGMIVAPALAEEAGASWWKERASLPELAPSVPPPPPPPPSRSRPVTVRPRSSTIPEPRSSEPPPPAELVDDGKPTIAMPALDPEPTGPDAEVPIVDDGKKTVMMHSVDLTALGLDAGASGQFAAGGGPAATDDADDAYDDVEVGGEDAEVHAGANGDPRETVPAPPTGVGDKKPHGKKRKKRR